MKVPKSMMRKKGKDDEQILAELSVAHCRLQAKWRLVQTRYIKQMKLFLFAIKIIITIISLTELSQSLLGES